MGSVRYLLKSKRTVSESIRSILGSVMFQLRSGGRYWSQGIRIRVSKNGIGFSQVLIGASKVLIKFI